MSNEEVTRLKKLAIHDLSARHHGLTQETADFCTQAARVCLDRHHVSPVEFGIQRSGRLSEAVTEWESTDPRTKGAWANETEATEFGACACALAAVELADGLVAVHRADTGTGADYYLAPAGPPPEDLEGCVRLEISGSDRGGPKVLAHRLREKLEQAAAGSSNLPAIAGVVGFQARVILLAPMERSELA